jgi:hypothetical protein
MKTLFSSTLLLLTLSVSFAAHGEEELDVLFTTPGQALRTPASATPEDLVKDFSVIGPERSPASLKAKSSGKVMKVAKVINRRSRLPASVSDGFELRVQFNKLTTTFWVVKRDVHYDLLFANSSGSRASVGLSQEDFARIYGIADNFKAKEYDIQKCKDSSIQLHVLSSKPTAPPEKTITMCVNAKTKEADALRNLSQALALAVR